jgi:hypothetical protein
MRGRVAILCSSRDGSGTHETLLSFSRQLSSLAQIRKVQQMPNPFTDLISPVLSGEPAITDDQRADIWDAAFKTTNSDEFAQHLAPLDVPTDLKARLYTAHKQQSAPTDPLDKIVNALQRLKEIDTETLDKAEKHFKVTQGILDATGD